MAAVVAGSRPFDVVRIARGGRERAPASAGRPLIARKAQRIVRRKRKALGQLSTQLRRELVRGGGTIGADVEDIAEFRKQPRRSQRRLTGFFYDRRCIAKERPVLVSKCDRLRL